MTSRKHPIAASLLAALAFVSAFTPLALALSHVQNPQPSAFNNSPAAGEESLAYARASSIRVNVVPERVGWTYRVGERVQFKVSASADGHTLAGLEIRYRVGPEMFPAEERVATLPTNGEPLLIDGGTLDEPGFIRCEVTIAAGGRSYQGRGTAGLSPSEIRPTQVDPADFDAFWAEGLADLAKIPHSPEVVHLPERSTPKVDVYHVGIRTAGGSSARVYGILCVPKGEGPFPAALNLPGAGVYAHRGNMALAERGVITLQIGIHGIPLHYEKDLYDRLGSVSLFGGHDYAYTHLDNRERYYYRRVYLSCVRANDFLAAYPKFDGRNLLVMGASQGGQLAIVTAALDPRVTALSVYHPAYCDVTGFLHGRAGGWPWMMRPNDDGSPAAHATEAKIRTTAYYDVVNFARRLKAPGHYSWGYNDSVCAPTGLYAAYNVITAPKKLLLAPEMGHGSNPEQLAIEAAWIADQLGLSQ